MIVAVTGATGFLGRYVVDALLARGMEVVGVVRAPDRVPELRDRIELRKADLTEPTTLAPALRGVHALVSNAALFSLAESNWELHQRINLEGTRSLLLAAADAGVRRVVHVSSVAVYKGMPREPATETFRQWSEADRPGRTSAYAISKALSEQLAWRVAKEHELALSTVRPSAIYGAFDPNFTRVLRRWLSMPLVPVPVLARWPFVYAGDVASAVAESLLRGASVGHAYNTAGDALSPWDVAEAFYEAGGSPRRLRIPIPFPIARRFDNGAAARDLGFSNRPLLDGFRDTFARERIGR